MGTLEQKWGPNGDPKTEKGPHGDRVPQMGTHVATVATRLKVCISGKCDQQNPLPLSKYVKYQTLTLMIDVYFQCSAPD